MGRIMRGVMWSRSLGGRGVRMNLTISGTPASPPHPVKTSCETRASVAAQPHTTNRQRMKHKRKRRKRAASTGGRRCMLTRKSTLLMRRRRRRGNRVWRIRSRIVASRGRRNIGSRRQKVIRSLRIGRRKERISHRKRKRDTKRTSIVNKSE